MARYNSPTKFPSLADENVVESVRRKLQLACYAVIDPSMTKEGVYNNVLQSHGYALDAMIREVRHKNSARQQLMAVRLHNSALQKQIEELTKKADDLQTELLFVRDGQWQDDQGEIQPVTNDGNQVEEEDQETEAEVTLEES